jgi:hypothetical protein
MGAKVLADKGFMDDRCDSLLFTALYSTACDEVDLTSWEEPELPGKWHRNPQRDCFVNGTPNGSASTISKDMFLGLWHYQLSYNKAQDVAETVAYGKAHNWQMGEGKDAATVLSRTVLTPELIFLLEALNHKLNGGALMLQDGSADAVGTLTGYQAHLQVLKILLQHRVRGAISNGELSSLKSQAERQPDNALYVASYERFAGGSRAVDILLDSPHFPDDRLPNNHSEHCTSYLHSRDQQNLNDWAPCPGEDFREHDGTDFVFAAWVILNL